MVSFPYRDCFDPAPVVRIVYVPLAEFRRLQSTTRPEDDGTVFIPKSPVTVYAPDPQLSSEEGPTGPDEFRIGESLIKLPPTLHEVLTAIWGGGAWVASYETVRQRVYGDAEFTQFSKPIDTKVLRDHVFKINKVLAPLGFRIKCDGAHKVMRRVAFNLSDGEASVS